MAGNKLRGASAIEIGGKMLPVSFSLEVLVGLGSALGVKTVNEVLERCQKGEIGDIVAVAGTLLRGCGHDVSEKQVMEIDLIDFTQRVLPEVFGGRPREDDASPRKPASR